VGQEDNSLCDLFRGANPALGTKVGDGLEEFFALAAEEELGARLVRISHLLWIIECFILENSKR
jgi:hypothetical protein